MNSRENDDYFFNKLYNPISGEIREIELVKGNSENKINENLTMTSRDDVLTKLNSSMSRNDFMDCENDKENTYSVLQAALKDIDIVAP